MATLGELAEKLRVIADCEERAADWGAHFLGEKARPAIEAQHDYAANVRAAADRLAALDALMPRITELQRLHQGPDCAVSVHMVGQCFRCDTLRDLLALR